MKQFVLSLCALALGSTSLLSADHVAYQPAGETKSKHIVLLAGDEEYRSEEALPMLGKILSQRHGFKCTVLFSLGADGTIDPTAGASLSHPEALDSADAIVMLLRFRHWDEATSKKFEAAVNRGVPIIALRTSTHAFNGYDKDSPFAAWNWNNPEGGWGRKVLGETWVSHWGKHKVEATKGIIEAANANHPVLRGVSDLFGNSDVYEAAPPADSIILARGQILQGMTADTPPASYKKATAAKVEQDVNSPMMPVAWVRVVKNDAGKENKTLCTTMGAATDLANEDLRRLVVNGVFWGLGLEVPEKADVTLVGDYQPTMYGFKGFKTGLKPDDFALGK
ncbi:ThuA domain-containing protein [Prosthecobacter sp.]|uniref:ThuA domain-containing protein n=1 Tax=Prosthecobacter sp. TaxID=1965333 RepID=UPI002ABA01A0|nr:ThuA domain-containing protein [Prosthecobacter sp.]MDZ4403919.1 ThuA domain-containing protein [Prosthecobacter sp.]